MVDGNASTTSFLSLTQQANGGGGGSSLAGLAGNGGAASASLSRTKNLASLSVSNTANAGVGGQRNGAGGTAGTGGDATADSTAVSVSSIADARGGAGGRGMGGSNGGNGGNAAATASGNNSTNQLVSISATATGGAGGISDTPGVLGGSGGTATASASGNSTGGGNVDVTASQNGGAGGPRFGATGAGGNGAASSITNAVSGSTTGTLKLFQDALGGAGGAAFGANAGHGANAFSSLTANNPAGGPLEGRLNTIGGSGGGTSSTGTPGNGGDATGFIEITNSNTAIATAVASAGPGGNNGAITGIGGVGTATARATTTGGFRVQALTSANGRTTSGMSQADTSSSGAIGAMLLRTNTQSFRSASTNAVGTIGGSQFLSTGSYNATLLSSALPLASDVNNALGLNPNVAAAYNSPDGNKTPLALVAMGLNSFGNAPTVATTLSATANYSFDTSMLTHGNLIVGLLDPISLGPGFTSLHFSITREGSIVEDQTFVTAAAAATYFNDHVLSLGTLTSGVSGTLDLSILLEMSTPDDGSRFGTTFLIADVGLVAGVPGDYNGNGRVDAADYVIWRKTDGTQAGYDTWRANFGEPAGSGSDSSMNTTVPEPATAPLIILAVVGMSTRRRWCACPVSQLIGARHASTSHVVRVERSLEVCGAPWRISPAIH